MKRLTLMRHGDAQWKDPDTPDFDRPLNRRGIAEVAAMAQRLLELELAPSLILASPARRTRQTAEIVARELKLRGRQVHAEESLYLAPCNELLAQARRIGPRIAHAMLIGHNPGLSELAGHLGTATAPLATAAVCSLAFEVPSWSAIAPGHVREVRSEVPGGRLFGLFA